MVPAKLGNFIRADLLSLMGYAAHQSPDTLEGIPPETVIKLDANENPYGCSPRVLKALGQYQKFNIYPDAGQTRLREQLQNYTGIDAQYLVAANGSGELLDYILCLLLEPGDEVINCVPTFDMYRFRTLINRGKLANVARDEAFAVSVNAIKSAITSHTKLIVLANPNNPTGNVIPREDLLKLVETGLPLLVDEAYYEFCGETVASLVSQHPNLMVLRTFSKWTGLAGLRMGYGVFPAKIASYLMTIKLPYNVNVAALLAVQESLKDTDYLMNHVKLIIAERDRLFNELSKVEWLNPFPSRANFIFCRVLKGNARELWQKLQNRGILVRYYDQPMVQNGIRFSVGKAEHTNILIKALRELEE